ncbi:hypothetical protein KEM55_004376 [Ascosphaera atra]|nr:hypothetical protein KEM55_004376 [Ascosphaera atra]
MSVYTLKELILKEWRSDWEARPASPTSIRLISFGKLLDDKMPLSECKFNRDAPNVVHMTLRPPSLVEEDPANNASKTAKAGVQRSSHEGNERTPGCRSQSGSLLAWSISTPNRTVECQQTITDLFGLAALAHASYVRAPSHMSIRH